MHHKPTVSLIDYDDLHRKIAQRVQKIPLIAKVVAELVPLGGRAFLVGGVLRDLLLGRSLEQVDIDIELHGVTADQVENLLCKHGSVCLVGKSFGVFKIFGVPVDWSLPRVDSAGRKPLVTVDPTLSLTDALRRRDLTMNALAYDLYAQQLYDPFGGREDMQAGRLRTPDKNRFIEDPLRFYRVMQFIGRFALWPDEELTALCKTMDLTGVSRERIEGEFRKLFLQSVQPSLGLRWIDQLGRLSELFPELAQLAHVEQWPEYHPEGDVLEHTFQTVDAAAQFEYRDAAEKLLIVYAALCHDLGKFSTTTTDATGRIRSIGHEIAGVPLARRLLGRMLCNERMMQKVGILVRYHMAPGLLPRSNAGLPAYKRLAHKVAPHISLRQLSLLAFADRAGRNLQRGIPLTTKDPEIVRFCERATEAGVFEASEPAVLMGADLLDVIPAGPALGKALERAYEIQVNEGITDPIQLRHRVLKKN